MYVTSRFVVSLSGGEPAEEFLLGSYWELIKVIIFLSMCTFHSPLASPPLPFDFIVKNGLNGEADKSDLHIFDFSVLIRE